MDDREAHGATGMVDQQPMTTTDDGSSSSGLEVDLLQKVVNERLCVVADEESAAASASAASACASSTTATTHWEGEHSSKNQQEEDTNSGLGGNPCGWNDTHNQLQQPGAYQGTPGQQPIRTEDLSYSTFGSSTTSNGTTTAQEGANIATAAQCWTALVRDEEELLEREGGMSSDGTRLSVATLIEEGAFSSSPPLQRARPSLSSQTSAIQEIRQQRAKRLCLLVVAFFFIMLLLLLGVGLALGFGLRRDGEESPLPPPEENITTTFVPTAAPTNFIFDLPQSTQIALQTADSPQTKAYTWLLNDPNLHTYPQWRRIQRFVLVCLYFATNGKKWKKNDNWLSYEHHECNWTQVGGWNTTLYSDADIFATGFIQFVLDYYRTGIMNLGAFAGDDVQQDCNDQGKIQILRLSNNHLHGVIPEEIGLLNYLINVILWHNKLVGTIPTSIGLLTRLEILQFSDNYELQGPIPTEIGKLTRLGSFSLAYMSSLEGTLPSEIGLMTNLYSLVVPGTSLTGSMPSEVGQLESLKLVHSENSLSGMVPSEFFQLTKLRYLMAQDSFFGGALPSQIGNLSNLEWLNTNYNEMTGTIPSQIGELTKLKSLGVLGNDMTGTIPSSLGLLSNLEFLRLSMNSFGGTVPWQLDQLTNLIDLELYDNPALSGSIPSDLCSLSKLDIAFNCSSLLCGCGQCECSST